MTQPFTFGPHDARDRPPERVGLMRSPETGDPHTLDSAAEISARRPEAGGPPAGWYRDSGDGRLHRFWDGLQWRSASGEYPEHRGLARVEAPNPNP